MKFLLFALLILAGCAAPQATSSEITLTPKMQQANNWTHYFNELYNPVMACLKAHPSQPAFAGDVTPMNHGLVYVQLQGKNETVYDCIIPLNGKAPQQFKVSHARDYKGPAFYPLAYGKPKGDKCVIIDEAKTTSGQTLGWLAGKEC